MIKKKLVGIIIVALLIWPLNGCWDASDVEQLDIVLVAGYDVPMPGQHGTISTTALYAAVERTEERVQTFAAHTVGETRARRAYSASRQFSLAQLQAIVLGEELALRGARDALDPGLRVPDVKGSLYLAVAEGDAGDFLRDINKQLKTDASQRIARLLRNIPDRAFVPKTTLHDFAVGNNTRGKTTVIPIIQFVDTDQTLEITGTALFEADKMVARFDRGETRTLVFLRGNPSRGWLPFFIYKKGKIVDQGTVFVTNNRKVKVSRAGDQFIFDIKVILTGRVVEHADLETSPFIDNQKHLHEVEDAVARDLRIQAENFIRFMQEEVKVDAIDITPYALAKWRKELTPTCEGGDFIEKAIINVEVEVRLQNVGESG